MELLNRLLIIVGWSLAALSSIAFVSGLVVLLIILRGDFDDDTEDSSKTEQAVAVVELAGEIFSSEDFREELEKHVKDKDVKAVVVHINSPGGSVGASEEIYNFIKRADEKKPVVCLLGNIAASGGLYASLGCRKVVAYQGTITGSIGVIMMMPQIGTVLDRFGVDMNVIKSGKFKDAGSPFRQMLPEERALLERLVDQANQQFVRTVSDERGLSLEAVRAFADGRIILGEQALELGLVDEIGDLYRSAAFALELSGGTGEPEIITKKKPTGLARLLEGVDSSAAGYWVQSLGQVRLLYRLPF